MKSKFEILDNEAKDIWRRLDELVLELEAVKEETAQTIVEILLDNGGFAEPMSTYDVIDAIGGYEADGLDQALAGDSYEIYDHIRRRLDNLVKDGVLVWVYGVDRTGTTFFRLRREV